MDSNYLIITGCDGNGNLSASEADISSSNLDILKSIYCVRDIDIEQIEKFLKTRSKNLKGGRIIFCSPDNREIELFKKYLSPGEIIVTDINSWDIDTGSYPISSDLVVACSVFMSTREPEKWFRNVLSNTRYFFMLDHCIAYRGNKEGEVAHLTGDHMRYTCPPVMISKFSGAFNLNSLLPRNFEVQAFNVPSECGIEGYETGISFISLIKGDLI
jgi:hypothetical protein